MENWIDSFLDYIRAERNQSPLTVSSYSKDINSFQTFMESLTPDASWADVKSSDIREWVVYLLDEKKLSEASVCVKLSAMRAFYRYLRMVGKLHVNPMERVTAPKKKSPIPYFVREKDMDRLLELTQEDDSFEGIRDRLVVMMFYVTGMRRAELLGLKDEAIDFAAKQVKVTGKRNKQRIIPFGDELEKELKRYINVRNLTFEGMQAPCLFLKTNGNPMDETLVAKIVKEKLSMVTTIKKKSPHVLRHSFATAMLNNNADLGSIQKLMGHASVATTEIYTHVSFEEMKNEYKTAHPRS